MELKDKRKKLHDGLELCVHIISYIDIRIKGVDYALRELTRKRLIFNVIVENDPGYNDQFYYITCIDTTKEVCRYEI